jgi:hypothetical protein
MEDAMTKCFDPARREAVVEAVVIALIFGFLAAGPLLADSGSGDKACPGLGYPGDEHRFRLFQHEGAAGDETFRLEAGADSTSSLSMSAEGNLDVGGGHLSFVQRLLVDRDTYALKRYDLNLNERSGGTQSIHAEQAGDSVVLTIEAAGSPFRHSFFAPGGAMVIDNLIMNHLALIACRVARDGYRPESLNVILPQVGALVPAVIAPQPSAADGTRKIEMRIASVIETLTIDSFGRFSRLDVPSQALHYDRMLTAFDMPQGAPSGGSPGVPPGGIQGAPPSGTPGPSPNGIPGRQPSAASSATQRMPDSGAPAGHAIFSQDVIRFVSNGTTLDGILTLPSAGQPIPYPAVLLEAGSGPQDRDGTIGANRPFLDLARGLAVNGIASLRYDNRPLAAPRTIDPRTVTLRQEVIDDAVAALDYMRSQTEVDGARLFIVGHGSGGSLAASIARADGRVTGLVIIDGTLHPLDAIAGQQLGLGGGETSAGSGLLRAEIDSLEAGTLPEGRLISGRPSRYYRDYASRNLVADFLAFRGPVLILRAGKDPEITMEDLDTWRETARRGGKQGMKILEFPDLGRALAPFKGEPKSASDLLPGNVDPSVIEAIGNFVRSTPRREMSR